MQSDSIAFNNSNSDLNISSNLPINNKVDYILVFLLIATSGIVFFYVNEEYIVISLILSVLVFYNRGMINKIDNKFLFIFFLFILWEIFQNFYYHTFVLKPIIGTFGRLLFAYCVVKIAGANFTKIFVNIIYVISIISLFFYILYFFPNVTNKLISLAITRPIFPMENQNYNFSPNLILFTFNEFENLRNSGPFWEPGAFSVFLCLGLLFNIIHFNKLLNKKNFLIILTILTTLSTAGYLTLSFIIISCFYFLYKGKNKLIIVTFMIIIAFISIVSVPFMLPKIENNVVIAENNNSSRFGSALSDYELFSKNPLLGYGRGIEVKYSTNVWDMEKMHRNNGISGFLVTWGILLFILYFYNYKISANRMCSYYESEKNLALVYFISVLLLGFSQSLFQYPFFHSLVFLQFSYNNIKT